MRNLARIRAVSDRVDKIEALVNPMVEGLKHVHCGVGSRCGCEVISTTNVVEVQSDHVQSSSGYYFTGFQEPAHGVVFRTTLSLQDLHHSNHTVQPRSLIITNLCFITIEPGFTSCFQNQLL